MRRLSLIVPFGALIASASALTAACANDRVTLSYGLEPGRQLEYRLTVRADIDRTLSGDLREQQVAATFRAGQDIVSALPGGGARAEMTLVPETLVVNGEPVAVGPAQRFLVDLAPDGRVVEIRGTGGGATEELAPVGLERLLPRLRPVVPGTMVGPGDTWSSDTEFTDADGRFSLSSRSRLEQLGEVDGLDAALVRTSYVSPVDRQERFANAVARMEGRDVGAQEAWFALDGFLVRAVGDSVGMYDLAFSPPGDETGVAPVRGALVVELHTEMDLLGSTE